MNPLPQPFEGQVRTNGRALSQRHSAEFRSPVTSPAMPPSNGHGPMPVPPVAVPRGAMNNNGQQQPGFAGARSPPNGKNTSHVPCKFFRQGACQAGKACPFLHSEAMTPCKYFQKGNCKFGMKCANEHITQDGRRVNKPGGYMMGPGPLNLGGRVMPPPGQAPTSSLLTMQQDHLTQPQPIPGAPIDYMNRDLWRDDRIPIIDTNYSSLPKSNYGSPLADGHLPMSPPLHGIGTTAANAQLPASFDSQGISKYARDGPFAASVPSRFGLDSSPPSSRPIESSALRNLHSSAFGDDNTNGKLGLPSSPPADELLGRRILHSERYSRNPRMISASVGARPPLADHDEWDQDHDGNFIFEENMVPNSLQDLLTPMEKIRRYSRNAEDDPRQSLSGLGTPAESTSKVGSPSNASPSRFGAFFAGRSREAADSSPFGPIGSPLKNSSLHPGASPSMRASSNPRPISGEMGMPISSPPRQASMSMISQQLQRTRLSDRVSDSTAPSPLQHPGISRVASGGSGGSSAAAGRLGMDRAVSSSSVGREKIDEEPEELFSMDEIGRIEESSAGPGASAGGGKDSWKRSSGGGGGGSGSVWGAFNPLAMGKASPKLGPIGGQRVAAKPVSRGGGGGGGGGEGV